MRTWTMIVAAHFAVSLVWSQADPAGQPSDPNAPVYATRAEAALRSRLTDTNPIIEVNIQRFSPREAIGLVQDSDRYLLGKFVWTSSPAIESLLLHPAMSAEAAAQKAAEDQKLLDGLVHLMVPDWQDLSPERYRYKFAGKELLGSVRCLVYDVRPRATTSGGFTGRIYIEDRMFTIVRFTGLSTPVDQALATLRVKDAKFRIDSWRTNVRKNDWVPSHAYLQEVAPFGAPVQPLAKGQVRFWGYHKAESYQQYEFVDIVLDASPLTRKGRKQPLSPQESQRAFESQAERNVIDRLFAAKLLGTPGSVEKNLEQVVMNLLVTNNLALSAPVRCRVLLTTPLETFSVGNTIFLSRGLIDVLPTEAALALVLAHQLAHHSLGHRMVDTDLAFADLLDVTDPELLAKLRFHHSPAEEIASDALALKLLESSLYSKRMAEAGLSMQAVQDHAKQLTHLIQPHFGEHIADASDARQINPMFRLAQVHNPSLSDQVAALPLGSKLLVHPWDGRVELLHPEPILAPKARERAEFAVTPFVLMLEYVDDDAKQSPISVVGANRNDGSAKRPVVIPAKNTTPSKRQYAE